MNKSVSKCELSRYIKLSSPRLNNMAVVGCILVYMAVILLGLDHATLPTNTHFSVVCTVSTSICNQSSNYMVQSIPIQQVKKFPTLLILKIHYLANKGSLVDTISCQISLVPPCITRVFIIHFNIVTSLVSHILNSGQIFWLKTGNKRNTVWEWQINIVLKLNQVGYDEWCMYEETKKGIQNLGDQSHEG